MAEAATIPATVPATRRMAVRRPIFSSAMVLVRSSNQCAIVISFAWQRAQCCFPSPFCDLNDTASHSQAMSIWQFAVLVLTLTLGNTHAIGVAATSAAIVGDADEPLFALT